MALTSTLFTGLSGLDVNQTRLNVIGNNIANANTTAFKASRATFESQFYVTDQAGTASSADFGGTNPSQRGLGASVASIDQDWTPGSLETTGKATDMSVDGNGFFIVKNGTEQQYTRDGSFTLSPNDQLVTASGGFVQGYPADASGNAIAGQLKNITIPLGSNTTARPTTSVTLSGNLDASGAVASGASILTSQSITTVGGITPPTGADLLTNVAATSAPGTALFTAGDVLTLKGQKGGRDVTPTTFTVTASSTLNDLTTFMNEGLGTDTAVAGPPTPGATIEASTTDPTSASLVVVGNTGTENSLALTGSALANQTGSSPLNFIDGTNAAGIKSDPAGESVHTTFVAYDSLGTPLNVDVTAVLQSKSDAGNTWQFYATSPDNTQNGSLVGQGTLTFDGNGALTGSTGTTVSIDRANTGAATPLSVKLDFGTVTQLTGTNSQLVMTQQDGSSIGTLKSFSVGEDGTIVGAYSNGINRNLGQIALATFKNNQGLDDKGGNMYAAGADSGVAVVSNPLELGAGGIRSGSLEMSNVDLSKEFTSMIVASTGFSASSRVITTSNQLLTDLLNTTR